jgi:hypothetical protein
MFAKQSNKTPILSSAFSGKWVFYFSAPLVDMFRTFRDREVRKMFAEYELSWA